MILEFLQQFSWTSLLVFLSAAVISLAVLFNKAITWKYKLLIIGVMALFVLYFLQQAGVLHCPFSGN